MEKLKMALVGLGTIGEYHGRIMAESDYIDLVAVCDLDSVKANAAAKLYDCKAYTDIAELAGDPEVQAVSICVPEDFHVAPVVSLAKAGKHILTEKPIAKTVAEAEIMEKACADNGVRLMVGQTSAYIATARTAKERYDAGQVGDLIQFSIKHQCAWDLGEFLTDRVSILFYMGVHDIYLAQWLFDKRIASIYAIQSQKKNPYAADSILMTFTYEDGSIGAMDLHMAFPTSYPADNFSFTINGTEQTIISDTHISGMKAYGEESENIDLIEMYELGGKLRGALADEINDFALKIITGEEFFVSTEEAIDAVRVIEAVFRSFEERTPIRIER